MRKHITKIILGVITIAELVKTGSMSGSFGLWVFYGVYKFID